MRAPFQEGDFPAPVKYGYLNVGVVEAGPPALPGRAVFCLYPHQTRYVVPAAAVVAVPDGVPVERAVLAGTVETAVNALWDAPPLLGDRVVVVGAGHGRVLRRPPARPRPRCRGDARRRRPAPREQVARALGVGFAAPADAPGDRDLVVHASATSRRAAALARPARPGRHGARPELVRRPGGRGARSAASFHSPRGCASGPAPSVGSRPRGAHGRTPPTGWRWPSTCCATRPSTRCSPAPRRSGSCRTSCADSRQGPCRRCATASTTRGSDRCSA